jgi:hypothetical protein
MKKQGFGRISERLASEGVFVPSPPRHPFKIFGEESDGSGKGLVPPFGSRRSMDRCPEKRLNVLR